MTDPTLPAVINMENFVGSGKPVVLPSQPVLQDIEQYRLQMAGISTAAIGYWKEGDSIHPNYDTVALRDVAKLYAKYDALYKAQPVPHAVIAGALFDFMAWLTTRDERLVLSGADEAGPAVEAITAFSKMRGLSLDDAQVETWQEALAQPEQEPVCPDCKAKVLFECVACSSNNYPTQQQAEPTPWREMVVVSLVREGIDKHRARELADHFAAQRPWQGLTDNDWGWVADRKGTSLDTFDQGAAWAQARLMERNK